MLRARQWELQCGDGSTQFNTRNGWTRLSPPLLPKAASPPRASSSLKTRHLG